MDLVRDKTKKDTYMCSSLLNQLKREEIRTDSPFQREANQWTPEAEYGLIVTAIRHEDIDSIKLCEQLRDSSVVVWLIDGKQRLTTLFKYRNNVFALGKGIEKPLIYYREARTNKDGNYVRDDNGDIIYDVIECDLRGKYYKDLPEKLKEEFDNFPIDVVKHLDCTDEEIGYHIRRYNRQTSMNAAQSSITYMDNAAKYVKNIASRCEFFKRACYRESERKKGIIERLVAESIMTMFHMTDWKKGSKQLGAYINLKSSQKEFEILEDLLKRLDKIVDENTETLFTSKNSSVMIAAFYYFSKHQVDIVILEVGLGGTYDATNVIKKPLLSLIMSISIDHTDFLGNTIEEIASEKCGIIKENCPVVLYSQQEIVYNIAKAKAAQLHAPLYYISNHQTAVHKQDFEGTCFSVENDLISYKNIMLTLLGDYQIQNCVTVLEACAVLQKQGLLLEESKIRNALSHTHWEGRMEVLHQNPIVLLDGAHNVDGISQLASTLPTYAQGRKITLLLGVLGDKEYQQMLSKIFPLISFAVLTEPQSHRKLDANILQQYAAAYDKPLLVEPDIAKAYEIAYMRAAPQDMIVCCGSLYMIGALRSHILSCS